MRIIDMPEGFEMSSMIMWLDPVYKAEDLPDSFGLDCVAYDLSSDPVAGPWFYVGLGEGLACHVQQAPFGNIKVCPHCGGKL